MAVLRFAYEPRAACHGKRVVIGCGLRKRLNLPLASDFTRMEICVLTPCSTASLAQSLA